MDSWQNDLALKKTEAESKLAKIKDEQERFLTQNNPSLTLNEKQYLDAIKILYEMLVLTVEESLCQIEQEIEMLNKQNNVSFYNMLSDSDFYEFFTMLYNELFIYENGVVDV